MFASWSYLDSMSGNGDLSIGGKLPVVRRRSDQSPLVPSLPVNSFPGGTGLWLGKRIVKGDCSRVLLARPGVGPVGLSVRAWVRVKVESVLPCSCIVLGRRDRGHGRDTVTVATG